MNKISVIIPVYNSDKYLSECLDSVINQTLSDIEIICVDDGSIDNSFKILKKYEKKDKRIKIIKQKNYGVAVARNVGVKQAKSDYIYFLDSDDKVESTALELMYKCIILGNYDIVTSCVKYFGNKTGEMFLPKPTKINMSCKNCLVISALMKKSDFVKAGGFDEKTELEDYDFWLKMVFDYNKKIYRIPKVLFYYRIKKVDESRNMQCKNKYSDIHKSFVKKYSQMKLYKLFNKVGSLLCLNRM